METKELGIIIGELIELGAKYFSRCGNKVKIIGRKEVTVKGKLVYQYSGHIISVISGHEILLNKIHIFDEKGKWLKNPGGIHDLVRKTLD